ncbi:hypothetical protein K0O62_18970 [Mycolicibacterium diernhoferi]|uniref:Uncharacterized protein n=2 Tax=Mycolicibacterium diernhoferi TaxID=1801 RepID=A0A1Q4HMQ1_9MYCO|nr:hypothetical protein BRW64_02070 [Mycolicibacterium diernhoferi]OPE53364.1 hypothetical protein BV510_15940 [Mycolicibacterium diernhoferi]PEG52782.1 hypothetical protein CRI78_19845 [Mycolicibacterium diernhoferi]QYL25672.1 hypothetical protein K0O62_18970 [Mycolicibacterium diernhoferi]
MRFELDVLGGSVEDVVKNAGGRLFDRARAGWDVTVLIPKLHDGDVRPLQILGVRGVDLEAALTGPPRCPAAYLVAASLWVKDRRVRALVGSAVDSGMHTVMMWGEQCPLELTRRLVLESREMSSAARAFKAHAVAACGSDRTPTGFVENFRSATPIGQAALHLTSAR